MRSRSVSPATTTWRRAAAASGDGNRCRRDSDSSRASRQEKRLDFIESGAQLVALDRARRVDVLRTDLRALANEGAAPDAFVLRQHFHAFRRALVAVVEVVALRQRDGGGADELGV